MLHILVGYWATSPRVTLLYLITFFVRMIFLLTCEADWNIPTEVLFPQILFGYVVPSVVHTFDL